MRAQQRAAQHVAVDVLGIELEALVDAAQGGVGLAHAVVDARLEIEAHVRRGAVGAHLLDGRERTREVVGRIGHEQLTQLARVGPVHELVEAARGLVLAVTGGFGSLRIGIFFGVLLRGLGILLVATAAAPATAPPWFLALTVIVGTGGLVVGPLFAVVLIVRGLALAVIRVGCALFAAALAPAAPSAAPLAPAAFVVLGLVFRLVAVEIGRIDLDHRRRGRLFRHALGRARDGEFGTGQGIVDLQQDGDAETLLD